MTAANHTFCRPAFALVAMLLTIAMTTGCSGDLDPSDPEDAYDLFRHALFDGEAQTVWERTDEQTREYFEDRYQRLQAMNDLIERYLPHTDHQIARSQSGAELVAEIDSGQDLFVRVFEPTGFLDDEAIRFGSEGQQIKMAEGGDSAVVVTRGGQEFVLVLQDDELWYINLVDSGNFLDEALKWLHDNEDALEQTVEDLIAEERQVREQIISELMDLEEE